ncbi:MAG: M20 family metallopeptidase [Candidatus Methanomethylicia archaeon]|nr:M20 family metallopeptidase [Candidatus Methanomethylicia archaeon]
MHPLKLEALLWVDKLKDKLLEISEYLYKNPELGSEEYKAYALLTSILSKHGFKVEGELLGMKTAFKASFKGLIDKPKIVFLAEYDALPEIGHGCGHNVIATTAVGAAIAISKVLNKINGEIIVIGTPAEEGHGPYAGSKITMVEKGVFNGLDAVLMMHPTSGGKASTRTESLTVQSFRIMFRGRTAHAAANPEMGINALNAVMIMFRGIDALRQHIRKDARIHGIIVKGGEASNVIPDYTEAIVSIRAADMNYLNILREKLFNCIKGAAIMTEAKYEVEEIGKLYREKKIYHKLADVVDRNLIEHGFKLISREELLRRGPVASTDFGNVTQVVPAISASIPITDTIIPGHSREFADVTMTDEGKMKTILATKVLVGSAMDLFLDAKTLEEVKKEFEEGIK